MSDDVVADVPSHPATFAYLHPGDVSAAFAFSFARMMVYETYRTGAAPNVLALRCASGQIVKGRNDLAESFLAHETDWLVMCDADMGFGADAVARLLETADPDERPAVGGLCFALKRGGETDWELQAERYRQCPTVYRGVETDTEVGFQADGDYERNALVQCDATGAAFFVVHRSALEKIRAEFGPTYFTPIQHPKKETPFGEDFSFFIRLAAVGLPLFVHTGIKTSHDKGGVFLTEETYDDQQRLVVGRDDRSSAG
jgi:hypothetical protein